MTWLHPYVGLVGVFLFVSLYIMNIDNNLLIQETFLPRDVQETFCTGLSCSGSIGKKDTTLTGAQNIYYTGRISTGGIHKTGITTSLSNSLQTGIIKTAGFKNMDIIGIEDGILKGKSSKSIPVMIEEPNVNNFE
jgi:hypothetical protein